MQPVSGLKIYKNEKEYIQFTKELRGKQGVKIDFEKRTIEEGGKKLLNAIDRKSTFFAIDRGGCTISYSADTNDSSCSRLPVLQSALFGGIVWT